MRLLCEKELGASKEEESSVEEVTGIERSFVENHLGLWLPAFCEKMMMEAQENFHRGIGHLTLGLVEYDREYLSWRLKAQS